MYEICSQYRIMSKIQPVILCGGSGTRLWPVSRDSFPKQFATLANGSSLFEATIQRIKYFGVPICIANEEHRFIVQESLIRQCNLSNLVGGSILLESEGRNTAAAMACAVLIPGINPSDLLLFLPSDHYVPDIDSFLETVQSGVCAAEAGYIVTFGVEPNFPSTAYGYIEKANLLSTSMFDSAIADGELRDTYLAERFIEKPDFDKAQEMFLSGNFLWNAGIFLCKASVLIDAMSIHAPDILSSCKQSMRDVIIDGDFIRPDTGSFLACRSESFDYAVMEHFEKVVVVPFKGTWSDVGSWNAVAKLSVADERGNRLNGQGLLVQSNNTYINSPYRLAVALGTNNLIIVDTPDAILVASSEKVEDVREVVVQLKKNEVTQAITHRRVNRPWGWYDTVDAGEHFLVKRIVVKPGERLSLQMHRHRAEHWIVVKGVAKVTKGEEIFLLKENQSTYIPIGMKHRLENMEKIELEMIEVQSGTYLGEDDIVRFEDIYGRN